MPSSKLEQFIRLSTVAIASIVTVFVADSWAMDETVKRIVLILPAGIFLWLALNPESFPLYGKVYKKTFQQEIDQSEQDN